MKMLVMVAILQLYMLSLSSCNSDCGTPVECYAKAIEALNQARSEYYTARDKLYNITNDLKDYFMQEISNDRGKMSTLETGLSQVNEKVDSVNNNLNSRVDDALNRLHSYNCREVVTGCSNDGGGNMVYLDRHSNFCNGNETMRGWRLHRCDNNHGVFFYYQCCTHP